MSWTPAAEPACGARDASAGIETIIEPHSRDLGGFSVRRVLPSPARRMVGPFVFFDEMGPAEFAPGTGIDVRPHPHINLATVTYLFEGEILHRDSLGSEQVIRPGEVNWMTAGRGIVHSERTPPARRATGQRLHGIQLWIALPRAHEESEPSFRHHDAAELPAIERDGARLRLLAGAAFGARSPVDARSPMFYADASLALGASVALPDEVAERAVYVVAGEIECGAHRIPAGRMVVLAAGAALLRAPAGARLMLLGGAALDGERHLWWNFVSSSLERIERAREDWRARRFPLVPGDETEFIPLPETR